MRRVLDILLDFKEYLALVVLCSISLGLFARSESLAIRGFRSFGLEVFGTAESGITFITRYFGLGSENERLLQSNRELSGEVNLLRSAREENERLKTLLAYKASATYPVKLARVIDRTFGSDRNLLTLNLGSADSVNVDMPVVTDRGLVGRVVLVSAHYAVVMPVINRDFKVPVYNERTRIYGIISWQGGDEQKAALQNMPVSSSLKSGDRLLTTDFSTFAAPNTPVGTVEKFEVFQGQIFYKTDARLAVDFTAIDQVFIEMRPPESERDSLKVRAKEFQ
ncbi:MAG: rod shape-determining protein MreC [Rhizobacter sp.]|nr:rod shape-determining protein MreC [Chlorobiales bacterium]